MRTSGVDFATFFDPRGVAVVGSLREPTGEALTVVRNLLRFRFTGGIYPINPSQSEVLGLRVYPALSEVTDTVDLAMVITPPGTVATLLEQCASKGVRAVIVGTEGFAERGDDGGSLQRQIVDLARSRGLRLLGPNTVGLVNTGNGLITVPYAFDYNKIRKGGLSFASQTGFAAAQGQPLEDRGYPISKMCDFGNKCDLNDADLLEYLRHDRQTKVIVLHMESVSEGHRFRQALQATAKSKPVLIFKTARTAEGARASSSHTGSLATPGRAFDALFRQTGAIRLSSWQEYWEIPKLLASQPLPKGNRIGVVTVTGGVGVAAVDAAVENGLAVAQLSGRSIDKLSALGVRFNRNPVVLGPAMVVSQDPLQLTEEAVVTVLADPGVDLGLVILPVGVEQWASATIGVFRRLKPEIDKPLAVFAYGTRVPVTEKVAVQLDGIDVPAYLDVDTAVKALAAAAAYARIRSGGATRRAIGSHS